ncbi:orotidine-5'-phosphate decarboxylase [Roseospira marina]|uniref:Orotidine 5'-phosphate decarboxylase n=1 Tax=Roseospira marina TaxID=140057 RepID=A0A5M6IAZ4_9PROT|nr:orotidine-5'-phosphate decarboxylase [Roseospira marina]KAA5604899.1 orotidine-5'-phosphate decarboxylase [Roseospira marina]MBB4315238.1 orotidine-5'-phosphate decarboxylase [Roseospira marina]MBB5088238.1 orotidine-5'-phosphate decarboxylase [Roseospira marina]
MSAAAARCPLFVALDTPDLDRARTWAQAVAETGCGIKLGLEFFGAHGAAGVRAVTGDAVLPVFLDLKFHDIPNTVAGAVRSVTPLAPAILNVHAAGGTAMMRAARDAAEETATGLGAPRPKVIAVTVLTSLDDADLAATGVPGGATDQVRRLAALAVDAGLDGVVCSAREAPVLRADLGPDVLLVTPGVRPTWGATGDQKRVTTPAEAMAAGASSLVVGRPITGAADVAAAARRVLDELVG